MIQIDFNLTFIFRCLKIDIETKITSFVFKLTSLLKSAQGIHKKVKIIIPCHISLAVLFMNEY